MGVGKSAIVQLSNLAQALTRERRLAERVGALKDVAKAALSIRNA
jgi:hypothetical protein